MGILHRIYCMDLDELTALVIIAVVIFLFLDQYLKKFPWRKLLLGLLFVIWLGITLYTTVFSRTPKAESQILPLLESYRQLLAGGNREILRSNYMNVLLFFPAGLLTVKLLPESWSRKKKLLVGALGLLMLSAALEAAQYYFRLGRVEMDDLLHNTLGAILGAIAACVPIPKINQE